MSLERISCPWALAGRPILVTAPGHDHKRPAARRDERATRRAPRALPPALAPLATVAKPAEVDTAYQGECPRGRSHVLHILHLGSRWRLFCTRGCSEGDILKAIGRPADVLRYRPPAEPRPPKERRFEYPELDGRPAFEVARKLDVPADRPGKERFIFRIDGKRLNSRHVPPFCKGAVYRLAELQRAPTDEPVFWCEGEKDVETLRERGLNAVTTSGGAHSYDPSVAPHFQGRRIVHLPDNDLDGQSYADRVAASLRGVAAKVDIVRLPGLPHKGDVSDWLAHGGTRDQLLKAASVPHFFRPTKAAPPAPKADSTKVPLGAVETAILVAIAEAEHQSLTTDALPMLVAGLRGESAWNARAREPITRYPDVPKEDLAKARAGISRALGSLARRGLIVKTGRWVRLAQAAPVRAAPKAAASIPGVHAPQRAPEERAAAFERPLTCRQCQTVFEGTPKQAARAARGKPPFCSHACLHAWQARRQRAQR